MFTSHGHYIPGTLMDDTDDNQRNIARCGDGDQALCWPCRSETIMAFQTGALFEPLLKETHDDQTIEHVNQALVQAVGRKLAQDCIREMQNAGILFRMRV